MSDLTGTKIVLLEARMNTELAALVRRHGGTPVSVPAVREAALEANAEVSALLDALQGGAIDYVVFQTGVGVMTLLADAEKLGRKEELLVALGRTKLVTRGPKPTAALARQGLKPTITTVEPHTTEELLAALAAGDLQGQRIALLHYGERNAALAAALTERQAVVQELCLYEWLLPADTTALNHLIDEIINYEFTAIAFTSQIQARHLFQLATEAGKADALRQTLNEQLVVASVGPTCSATLRELGVMPHVEPEHPKMGFLVQALMEHLQQRS
jgi:uroporphyrinogen-III synthase